MEKQLFTMLQFQFRDQPKDVSFKYYARKLNLQKWVETNHLTKLPQ